jgi:acetylglutamate kinase
MSDAGIELVEVTTPEQIEHFRALLVHYAAEREGGFSERMTQDLRDLPGRYAAPNGGMFLALVDGEPVATAAWTKFSDALVEMKRVYVQPAHRGKGLGKALSRHIIAEAKRHGFVRVGISTWTTAQPAIDLYRSLGFAEIPPFKTSTISGLTYMGLDLQHVTHTTHAPQVIKVSGSDLDDPAFSAQFAASIAAITKSGTPLVVVHGGGKELTELLAAMNVPSQFVDGLRVTDAKTRDAALMVLSGLANKRLVAALLAQGVSAIGLSGVDAGLIRVARLSEVLGFVGKPTTVRAELITQLLSYSLVPVLSPMSIGVDGEIYNVNADHAAGTLADALDADLLTFVTNVPGVLDGQKSLISNLSSTQTESFIADGTIFGGMIPKVRTALEALQAGVKKVRITNLAGLMRGSGTVFYSE